MAGVDIKTRYQGIYARHQEGCRVEQDRPCNCTPSYFGTAWDRVAHRTRKTRHFRLINEARPARADLQASLKKGEVPVVSSISFADARTRFIKDVKNGTASTNTVAHTSRTPLTTSNQRSTKSPTRSPVVDSSSLSVGERTRTSEL
jgi:hypothetical protein